MSEAPAAVSPPPFAPDPRVAQASLSAPLPTPTPAATPALAPVAAAKAEVQPEIKTEAPAAPKRLITDAPAPTAEAPKTETVKADAAPADWKVEAPKDTLLSTHELSSVEAYAKKAGLTKDQAQGFVNEQHQLKQAEISRTNDLWYDQSNADPEIGGAKMPATVANVQKALGAFATAEERKSITNSPFANNPLFLRIMNRVAASLPKEDQTVPGASMSQNTAPTTHEEAARRMYPGYYKRK